MIVILSVADKLSFSYPALNPLIALKAGYPNIEYVRTFGLDGLEEEKNSPLHVFSNIKNTSIGAITRSKLLNMTGADFNSYCKSGIANEDEHYLSSILTGDFNNDCVESISKNRSIYYQPSLFLGARKSRLNHFFYCLSFMHCAVMDL